MVIFSGFVIQIEAVVEVDSESGWQAPMSNGHTELGGEWMIMLVYDPLGCPMRIRLRM